MMINWKWLASKGQRGRVGGRVVQGMVRLLEFLSNKRTTQCGCHFCSATYKCIDL